MASHRATVKIWVNGFYLGTNASGYCGVSYDISNYISFDKENVLVVRVDASQYEGWYYEGAGIYRHVWLNCMNNLHIAEDGVFLHSTVVPGSATVSIETKIINENSTASEGMLTGYITDRYGKIVAKSEARPLLLSRNETKSVSQKMIVTQPVLWSPDNPYLYRAIVEVTSWKSRQRS